MRAHSMRLPPFARRSTMGTTDRSKKRSRRCAARLRRHGITARLSCSFNFLTLREDVPAENPPKPEVDRGLSIGSLAQRLGLWIATQSENGLSGFISGEKIAAAFT